MIRVHFGKGFAPRPGFRFCPACDVQRAEHSFIDRSSGRAIVQPHCIFCRKASAARAEAIRIENLATRQRAALVGE
jgi:hypothetical protein